MIRSYELVTISEKSAMVENSANSVLSSVKRFCRMRASGAFTSTLSKNRSTLGRSREITFSIGWPAMRRYSSYRSCSGPASSRLSSIASAACELGLLQNVADAFEAGGQRFEIGRRAQVLDALQARFQIHQVAPAGGHGGVHFVVLEAADILEVELDAIFEEARPALRRRR